MKRISNEDHQSLKNNLSNLPRQTLIDALASAIEIIQSDGCAGCVYATFEERDRPSSKCKRVMLDFYRKGNTTE